MTTRNNPPTSEQRTFPWVALWLLPWVLFVPLAITTVIAANVSAPELSWLRPFARNEVYNVLGGLVAVVWLGIRGFFVITNKARWLVVFVAVFELPLAFFVFLFWAVGMIGGPINPG